MLKKPAAPAQPGAGHHGQLVVCTVLYVAVAAVLTGMIPYRQINKAAPLSAALQAKGLTFAGGMITLGILAGMTSSLLVGNLSQPRILLAMAHDGLLPHSFFGAVHSRFKTPWKSTILVGVVVAAGGALAPLGFLADLVSIGTLFAFVIVSAAVDPADHRPRRAPAVPHAFCAFRLDHGRPGQRRPDVLAGPGQLDPAGDLADRRPVHLHWLQQAPLGFEPADRSRRGRKRPWTGDSRPGLARLIDRSIAPVIAQPSLGDIAMTLRPPDWPKLVAGLLCLHAWAIAAAGETADPLPRSTSFTLQPGQSRSCLLGDLKAGQTLSLLLSLEQASPGPGDRVTAELAGPGIKPIRKEMYAGDPDWYLTFRPASDGRVAVTLIRGNDSGRASLSVRVQWRQLPLAERER